MPPFLKPYALSLAAVFVALALAGPQPARAADGCSAADFQLARSFDAGSGGGLTSRSYAAADLNGDGRPDLVSVDFSSNAVVILLNDGAGWLGEPRAFGVGNNPTAVAVGDFNADGRPDLAVTNQGSHTVSVLLGEGGGQFGGAAHLAFAGGPRSVVVGDFNNDGRADLAVGTADSNSVSVLLGNGAGAFAPAGPTWDYGDDVYSLATADFNNDGRADLAVATGQRNFAALGDGAGGFAMPSEVGGGSFTNAAADLNGDNKPDLLFGNFAGLHVRLGDGAGNFAAPTVFAREGDAVNAITLGDLDGDGKLDAAVGGNTQALTYFKGDGAGGFTPTRSYLPRQHPNSIALGDFDGDGDRDIAAGNSLLFNTGAGAFEAARAFYSTTQESAFGSTPTDLALGDFNGDGRQDFAITRRAQSGTRASIVVMLDNGAGSYAPSANLDYFQTNSLNRIVTADFNNDGKTDLAAAAALNNFPTAVVTVRLGNGDGTFGSALNSDVGAFGFTPWDLAVGDFNVDGTPDLIASVSQGTAVLMGNGNGFFAVHRGPDGFAFDRLAVGNFNADAHQDFVITDRADGRVVVVTGGGSGSFSPHEFVNVAGFPAAVVVADFNADGKPDIASANQSNQFGQGAAHEEGSVSVLLGQGGGFFTLAASYEIGATPDDITAGDFDGDGKLDIAVNERTTGSLYVLSGDGAGAFSNAAGYDFPGGVSNFFAGSPMAFAAHDLDGDSRLDIASLVGSSLVGVLYGKPAAPRPCVFADDLSVTEGNGGTTSAQIPVRLSGASGQVVKVNYVLRGTPGITGAVDGQDFTGGVGTITFQPGETTKHVSVPIFGDTNDELDESFTLTLSGPLNARLSDRIARVNISDDDAPPAISISDMTVAEGNFSTTSASFNVTLSAPSALGVRVDYAVTAGTATGGTDFFGGTGTVFFEPGSTTKTVNVSVVGDNIHEPDETLFVTLSNPVEATIADGQAQGTILNDDPVPSFSPFDFSGFEAPNGADSTATVTVRLSNPSSQPVTVGFATADGTATAGSDYLAASGTVTFDPGQTQKTIVLTIKDDAVDEAVENFFVNFSNPTGATISDAQALGQIFDNDGPAVSVSDVTVVEGGAGRTNAVFTLTLSAPSPQNVGVRFSTANGTAFGNAFPQDFVPITNRFVLIPAGSTSATTTVFVNGDHIIEPDENFIVTLSQPQDATIGDGQGVGNILNDDTTSVQFNTDAVTVSEVNGKVEVTATRVGDTSGVFDAAYNTSPGTASDRTDYNAAFGTLRFEPGETTKTITVFITDDVHDESAETFFIGLTGADGGATNQPSFVTVTINGGDLVRDPNPIDNSAFFVRQHYRDFLGRDPDADGLAHWTGEIESCGTDQQCREVKRVNVSAAFFLSIEFQETGYLAYRTHKAAFGDTTSPNVEGTVPSIPLINFLFDAERIGRGVQVGVGDWFNRLEANKEAYVLEFVQRPVFTSNVNFPLTLTAEQFVDRLNQRAGGVLTDEERTQLINTLGATPADAQKRSVVLRRIAEDADLRQRETNRAFVLMQYFGYLRRNPDDPQDTDFRGWKFWLDKLNEHHGNFVTAEMVKAFIISIEYRQRFGQ